jgi:hypothetical protein
MKTPLRYDTMHADDWRIGHIAVSWCHLVVILDLYWAYIVVHSWATQPWLFLFSSGLLMLISNKFNIFCNTIVEL